MIYNIDNKKVKFDPDSLINEALIDESITKEELAALDEAIHEAMDKDEFKYSYNKSFKSAADDTIRWLKGKYTAKFQKIVSQSKEVNDMYQKVMDLLKNDKFARFRHRNDAVDIILKSIVLRHNKENKSYNPTISRLMYNANYIAQQVDQAMAQSKNDPSINPDEIIFGLIAAVQEDFNKNEWYTVDTTPNVTVTFRQNIVLESAVKYFADVFENFYSLIYAVNKTMEAQLLHIQIFKTQYDTMQKRYGTTPQLKKLLDTFYGLILKNSQISMDFNNKMLTCISAVYENAYKELVKIYDIIKS